MWPKPLNSTPALATAGINTGSFRPVPAQKLRLFKILALPAALLSLGDAFLTQYLVGVGRVQEGNPLMARLLVQNQFMWFKILGTAACLVLTWQLSKRFPRLAGAALLFMIVFYSGVLLWNSSVLSIT